MKKIFTFLAILLASMSFGQTISQWNFDNPTPATAMLPTTGVGIFQTIGGVVDNLTNNVMPAGNPTATGNLAYSIKTFPASGTASGTAGFQFNVSTVGYTSQISVSFDPRGSNTASRFQQYEYSINGGNTWTIIGNNGGLLTNTFTTTPMVTVTLPLNASNQPGFAFRIVSIFDPAGTDYSAVAYNATTPSTYGTGGAWRIDNFTVYTGTLSTNQNSILDLKIFPNPSNSEFVYVTSSSQENKNIEIFDFLGKNVLNTTTSNEINISSLKSGIYLIKITEGNNTSVKKLVVK
jgi:hypothetical protein